MKEVGQIITRRSHEVGNNMTVQSVVLGFFTPNDMVERQLGDLFDITDENKKYAVAIGINSQGASIKAALMNVDQARYLSDVAYREKCIADSKQLFGPKI